jgi:hypothetical protein
MSSLISAFNLILWCNFSFMGSANTGDCAMLMSSFDKLCLELGVPLSKNKTMDLCILLPFQMNVIQDRF